MDFFEDDWFDRVFAEHATVIGPALASLFLDNYFTLCWIKSSVRLDGRGDLLDIITNP